MTGLKTTDLTRAQVLAEVRAIPTDQNFVLDGIDQDDRPLTKVELQTGIVAMAKKRGRPAGSGGKEQIALRVDHDVLSAFRATGAGWQTRMNDALKDWLNTHSPV
ncbi:BrnA antitoxin family protein [Rhodoferax antarcticus]|uniref:BrnA antitoxin of type II toxin-antitoxin system n=1 Tax=Rhodoferax antarcticus ANT.BR TaxID=1111071 RepID=A0A1Q8YJU9_9BURK|nr:BrnA antitoxin family protein [Rhodoferax antarcticus]APW47555.1 hypothetical protein RA876_15690 [Rhodoferax antarcticus]MCW2311884.1 uncharacterized protein (DUF4415 family) [Rhodoferax antarcticus]OLP08334.1 hypothetical protein BLL52_0336 [Rhodoferax antarcticus ANT.BR]